MATVSAKLSLRRKPKPEHPIGALLVINPTPHEAECLRLLASSSCAVFHTGGHVSTSAAVPVLSCNVALAGESQEAGTRCVEKRTKPDDSLDGSDDDLVERTTRKPAKVDGGCSKLAENTPVSHSV